MAEPPTFHLPFLYYSANNLRILCAFPYLVYIYFYSIEHSLKWAGLEPYSAFFICSRLCCSVKIRTNPYQLEALAWNKVYNLISIIIIVNHLPILKHFLYFICLNDLHH